MYVARPELGTKRLCIGCAARFYDLARIPARCPTCGVEQPPPRPRSAAIARGAGARWSARAAPVPALDRAEAAADDAAPLIDAPEEIDDDDDDAEIAEVVPPEEET